MKDAMYEYAGVTVVQQMRNEGIEIDNALWVV
jgi:hypothetical protein